MTKYPSIETYIRSIPPMERCMTSRASSSRHRRGYREDRRLQCTDHHAAGRLVDPRSRGELLYGENDLIINPAHNIVATLSRSPATSAKTGKPS
jgi:hypothetical protein